MLETLRNFSLKFRLLATWLQALAAKAERFTGADCAALVREAGLAALQVRSAMLVVSAAPARLKGDPHTCVRVVTTFEFRIAVPA